MPFCRRRVPCSFWRRSLRSLVRQGRPSMGTHAGGPRRQGNAKKGTPSDPHVDHQHHPPPCPPGNQKKGGGNLVLVLFLEKSWVQQCRLRSGVTWGRRAENRCLLLHPRPGTWSLSVSSPSRKGADSLTCEDRELREKIVYVPHKSGISSIRGPVLGPQKRHLVPFKWSYRHAILL